MTIVELSQGNCFGVDNELVAALSYSPDDVTPYKTFGLQFTHKKASVVAFAMLSGLRSHLETTDDDAAFEHVLRWLERYSKGESK